MIRALSVTCVSLLCVALAGATAAAAKPSIAVLGLEVVDPSGTPTPADTEVAKELTTSLRQRARAGTGTYQYAPGSEKELIDEKLVNNCNSEAISCMVAIGKQVGADVLIYGRLERLSKGYQLTITLLDVVNGKRSRPLVEPIPFDNATGPALQVAAKRIYAKLTGETSAGSLVVKLTGATRGTIYIDGDPKGSITSGTGEVSGLSEGRHELWVEVGGFRRWEKSIQITAGQTTNVPVDDLEASDGGSGGNHGGGTGDGSGSGIGIGSGSGPIEVSHNPWKSKVIGGAVVTGVLAIGFGVTWHELASTGAKPGFFTYGANCTKGGPPDMNPGQCPNGSTWTTATYVTGIAAVLAAGFTGFAIYKSVKSHPSSSEHALTRRKHRDRFVITPVLSPRGGGATLRIDW